MLYFTLGPLELKNIITTSVQHSQSVCPLLKSTLPLCRSLYFIHLIIFGIVIAHTRNMNLFCPGYNAGFFTPCGIAYFHFYAVGKSRQTHYTNFIFCNVFLVWFLDTFSWNVWSWSHLSASQTSASGISGPCSYWTRDRTSTCSSPTHSKSKSNFTIQSYMEYNYQGWGGNYSVHWVRPQRSFTGLGNLPKWVFVGS